MDAKALIFLDVDGVLNSFGAHNCGPSAVLIRRECVGHLDRVIAETDARIVLSSSWRYIVHEGAMTLDGFAYLLRTHGLSSGGKGLVAGLTRKDERSELDEDWADDERARQVMEWRTSSGSDAPYVILDDCDFGFTRYRMPLVRTDNKTGMTAADADRAIEILRRPR